MRIHIENDIYISGEGLGFTIDKKMNRVVKDKKTGIAEEKIIYETVKSGNFTNLAGALKGLLKLKASESKAETIEELLKEIESYTAFIESKIKI